MKTAVAGAADEGHIVLPLPPSTSASQGLSPYRAKTKGKVEPPSSYIRQDFFLARSFRNLVDLNRRLQDWLDTVANVRLHGTRTADRLARPRSPSSNRCRRCLRRAAQTRTGASAMTGSSRSAATITAFLIRRAAW
jgi:hypothetical protein